MGLGTLVIGLDPKDLATPDGQQFGAPGSMVGAEEVWFCTLESAKGHCVVTLDTSIQVKVDVGCRSIAMIEDSVEDKSVVGFESSTEDNVAVELGPDDAVGKASVVLV